MKRYFAAGIDDAAAIVHAWTSGTRWSRGRSPGDSLQGGKLCWRHERPRAAPVAIPVTSSTFDEKISTFDTDRIESDPIETSLPTWRSRCAIGVAAIVAAQQQPGR